MEPAMSLLYFLLPVSLLMAFGFLLAFVWSVKKGQLDDLDSPPLRALFDEEDSKKKIRIAADFQSILNKENIHEPKSTDQW